MKRSQLSRSALVIATAVASATALIGQTGSTDDWLRKFEFRSVGPSLTSGRLSDVAIDPKNPNVWYVAASAGNLWKTENRGNTWTPIFDEYGSYSLGTVVVDPRDSNVVWLGTGENNNQRSVSFGDGVYKSTDAGKSWQRMGLEHSEHVQNIVIDPRNSNVVYVTAIGPLWASGGDRGLFKTTDGGKTWASVLTVSAETGVTDVILDPHNPDVMYAAAYQRRRAVGQLIGGGPESGLYKSTNAGKTWTRLTKGLPAVDIGRIGLGINWRNSRTVYALVTAQRGEGGFFRSDDAGASWTRIGRRCPVLVRRCSATPPHRVDLGAPPRRPVLVAAAARRPTSGTAAATPVTTTKSSSMRTIPKRSGRCKPTSIAVSTAARPGNKWRFPGSTSITTKSCSTRPTRTTSSWATTAGSTKPTTG